MRSLLVLPLGLLVGCTFQVSAIGLSDGGSRDLSRPDLNGSDRPMRMDQSVDAAPDLLPPGPDLARFDLAGFVCPGGYAPWHIGELTEGDVNRWAASDPSGNCQGSLNPVADTTLFTTGTESISLQASGCATAGLIYPKGTNAGWDLSRFTTLTFDIASDMPGFAMTSPTVFLVDTQMNYYTYSNASGKSLLPDKKKFAQLAIKLDGSDPSWPRSSTGIVSLAHINYVAVTWGNNKPSYTVWLDNLAFVPGPFVDCSPP